MNDETFDFGTLTFFSGKNETRTGHQLLVDRVAIDDHAYLFLLSVVGPQGEVKALRATLHAKTGSQYSLDKLYCTNGKGKGTFPQGFLKRDPKQKFLVYQHSLGYGQIHALFLSQEQGFLRVVSDESVFRCLKSTEYTTPLLRSWVPWIKEQLENEDLIEPLFCFRCQCAKVTAVTSDLDTVVTRGVETGNLKFRELSLVGEGA